MRTDGWCDVLSLKPNAIQCPWQAACSLVSQICCLEQQCRSLLHSVNLVTRAERAEGPLLRAWSLTRLMEWLRGWPFTTRAP